MTKKKIIGAAVVVIILLAIIAGGIYAIQQETKADSISVEEANTLVNSAFDNIAKNRTMQYIAENNKITVKNVSYGNEKDIILDCTIDTIDVYGVVHTEYDRFLSSKETNDRGMTKSGLDFKLEFESGVQALMNTAPKKSIEIEIVLYDTKEKGIVPYFSDEAVNAVYGGIIDVKHEINAKTSYKTVDESGNEITVELDARKPNVKNGLLLCFSPTYDSVKPDTSGTISRFINKQKTDFELNFIQKDRWKTIFKGLWVTIQITFLSLIIGVFLGFIIAFVRFTYIKKKKRGIILKLFNLISQIYLTVLRGTPVVVQILIIHFVILQPMGVNAFVSAFICFGLNSGAYVAEIVRSGIMSIDEGQTEAGRSLGLNYYQTMLYIIAPQALKNVLPALANEFVVLLKETSIAFYIGIGDLMYSVNAIRAATYSPFMPLIASAVIYLVMVLFFSKLVNILERRLRNSER